MTPVEPSAAAEVRAVADTDPRHAGVPPHNPFPGPQAYRRDDREYFFGRAEETEELTSLVLSSSATLLYAQSGAGKSSLLQAGVAPYLESGFNFVILPTVRLGSAAGRRPTDGANPFVQVVCESIAAGDEPHHGDIAAAAETRRSDESQRALLVLDQFEEVFNHPGSREDRQQFFRQLTDALEANTWLRAIIALRSDYLADLVLYERHLPANLVVRYQLEHMVEEQAAEAIASAFALSGMDLGDSNLKVVLDALFQRSQDSSEPSANPLQYINAIQLQIVCRGLWEELHAKYAVGPVPEGALTADSFNLRRSMEQFVDEAIRHVVRRSSASEKEVRWWLENALITPLGRRAFVLADADATAGLPNAVVESLEDVRLVQLEQRRQGLRLAELTHDSMIDGVRTSNAAWRQTRYRRRRRTWISLLAVLAVLFVVFWPSRANQPGIVAGPVAGVLGDSPKLTFSGRPGQAVIVTGSVGTHQHVVSVEVAEAQPEPGGPVFRQQIDAGPGSGISLAVQTVPGHSYVARLVSSGDASVPFSLIAASRAVMPAGVSSMQFGPDADGAGVVLDPASGGGPAQQAGSLLITVAGRSLRAVEGVPEPVVNKVDSWAVVPRPAGSGVAMLAFDPVLPGAEKRETTVRQIRVDPPEHIGIGGSAQLDVNPVRLVAIDAARTGQAGVELKCEGSSVVKAGFAGAMQFAPKSVEQGGTVLPLNDSSRPAELVLYSSDPATCAVDVRPYRTEQITSFGSRDLEVPAGWRAAAFPIVLPADAALVMDVPNQLRPTVNCKSPGMAPTGIRGRLMTLVQAGSGCELWLIRSGAATEPLRVRIWAAELNGG